MIAGKYNYDIFHHVMDQLYLDEILNLRLVCKKWQKYIDIYLKEQRQLSIYYSDSGTSEEYTYLLRSIMNVEMLPMFRFMIRLYSSSMKRLRVSKIWARMPNIYRLVIMNVYLAEEIRTIGILLDRLCCLTELTIISENYQQIVEAHIHQICYLDKLIVGTDVDRVYVIDMRIKKQKLSFKSLSVNEPFHWTNLLNKFVVTIGFGSKYPNFDEYTSNPFPALRSIIVHQDPDFRFLNFLESMHRLNIQLEAIEVCFFDWNFYHPKEFGAIHRYIKNIPTEYYINLFIELNRFTTLKRLRFRICDYKTFATVLRNLWRFVFVEEICLDVHFCNCSHFNTSETQSNDTSGSDHITADDAAGNNEQTDLNRDLKCRTKFGKTDLDIIKNRKLKSVKKIVVRPIHNKNLFTELDFTGFPCEVQITDELLPYSFLQPYFDIECKLFNESLNYD